jgi:hypothetical protein
MTSADYVSHAGLVKTELEGDFNQVFDLYVEPNAQVTVREILTPDVMAELMDSLQGINVELIANSVIFSIPKIITTKQEIEALANVSGSLVEKISPMLGRL